MKFKLDENLGHAAAEGLRVAGHDVATVVDQDMTSSPDASVYAVCRAEGRTLVTLDVDFADPITYRPEGGPGIAVLRIGSGVSGKGIQACLKQLGDKLALNPIEGRLWIIEVHQVREYRSP